jgi:rod shape determining protein RodA
MKRLWTTLDPLLFASASLLLLVSITILYGMAAGSVEGSSFLKQVIFVVLGTSLALVITYSDYRHLQKYSTLIYFVTLAVLIFTLLFGQNIRGTSGWLSFGFFQLQPVEIAKISLTIFLASFIAKKKTDLDVWTRVIASAVLGGVMILLVLKQPDLGSSLVLLSIWAALIVASGIRAKHMAILGAFGAMLILVAWLLLAPYQKERIYNFFSPERDPLGTGYNVIQALVAVGSGGITGKGLGTGSQGQLNFLPEKHTDFIYAVIAEELGAIGALAVIILYALLLYRIWRIGEEAQDNFGYLIALGIFMMFFVQITINLGMNMGLLPVTGLTAPLLSYGGSSLLSFFLALGLLGSIYRQRRPAKVKSLNLEKNLLFE